MKIIRNIQYNQYKDCLLDFYIPEHFDKAIILFHGGGLIGGTKDWDSSVNSSKYFAEKGYFVTQVNYRFINNYDFPDFLFDAADSIKYTKDYIHSLGKEVNLYVGGHSAGAFISIMLCMNKEYLNKVDLDPMNISGWLIDSAQMTSHFNILQKHGIDSRSQVINEYAPLFYLNEKTKFTKVLLIVYTDDMLCRLEQNQIFYKAAKAFNENADIEIKILEGGHCSGLDQFVAPKKSVLVDLFDNFINK